MPPPSVVCSEAKRRASTRTRGLGLLAMGLFAGALAIGLLPMSCADSSGTGDLAMQGPPVDATISSPDLLPPSCFMGAPATELELLNHCTPAEQVDRESRVPPALWDGKGPLPAAP